MHRFKNLRRTSAIVLMFTMLALCAPPRAARADEPVTVTTVIVVGAAVTTIATGAVWLWDRFFGDDKKKVCTTTTTTTTTTDSSGHTTTTTTTTTSYSMSPAEIRIPEDVPELRLPPGVKISEDLWFDGRDDQHLDLRYQNVVGKASILDPGLAPDVVEVTYDVDRETIFRWDRPPGTAGQESMLDLSLLAKDLEVSTTDVTQTHGLASWELTIDTTELGRVYSSSVNATQGAPSVVSGSIPTRFFDLSTPGRAALKSYTGGTKVKVPGNLNTLTFKINMRTHGIGRNLERDGAGMEHPMDN
jgi:hypothetical protein